MLLPLLLLAADPETAVDAERAFNRAAQIEGQWTAFRKFSTADALMFTPQPVKAHDWLPLKDPPITVQWWPAESYVSCDGTVAVNTGPWVRPGAMGYFTTVWVRQADGHFKWVYDAGDALAVPRRLPEKPKVRAAFCPKGRIDGITIPHRNAVWGEGGSPDGTLAYNWSVKPDGARSFHAFIWDGSMYRLVVHDEVAAPK